MPEQPRTFRIEQLGPPRGRNEAQTNEPVTDLDKGVEAMHMRASVVQSAVLVAASVSLLASCGTTVAAQSKPGAGVTATRTVAIAEYPADLRGHWMPIDMACTTPINFDSDVLVVIDKDHFGRYEDANKPVTVQRISSDPQAWSIKSFLNIGGDGYDTPVSEVFVLGGRQLAIVGEDGIKTYQRCN